MVAQTVPPHLFLYFSSNPPGLRCPVFAARDVARLQKADRCPCSASLHLPQAALRLHSPPPAEVPLQPAAAPPCCGALNLSLLLPGPRSPNPEGSSSRPREPFSFYWHCRSERPPATKIQDEQPPAAVGVTVPAAPPGERAAASSEPLLRLAASAAGSASAPQPPLGQRSDQTGPAARTALKAKAPNFLIKKQKNNTST